MSSSIINFETLNRISDIFPCVIWKDYTAKNGQKVNLNNKKKISKKDGGYAIGFFDKNTDYSFHKKLMESVENSKSDYDLIVDFYNFKTTPGLSNSRQLIFKYLLPPENEFFQIPNIQNTKDIRKSGIYFFFNEYFIEAKFNDKLKTILPISISLNPGENFPAFEFYNNKSWICYYNNDGPRFTWDKNIDWNNYGYSVNSPWDGFKHYCQYMYTLIRIGYEEKIVVSSQSKTDYKKAGLDYLYKKFKLQEKRIDYNSKLNKILSNDEYEESDYVCLLENINYGIERTKSSKDVFYIKDFEDTVVEINLAIAERKYEKKHVFIFSQVDKILINSLYEKYYEIMPRGMLADYSDKNFTSRFEELNKIVTYIKHNKLDDKDISKIQNLQKKFSIKKKEIDETKIESGENERDKEVFGKEVERNYQMQKAKAICIRYGEKFSHKEYKYKEWIEEFINDTDGVLRFLDEAKLLCDRNPKSLLITKYIKLFGGDDTIIETLITSFKEAGKEILEECDG